MMRLFKPNVLRPSQVQGHVVNIELKSLHQGIPNQVIHVADHPGENFHLDDLVIKQTGLNELQKRNLTESIETEVLRRLKEVEEKAFAEAHKLGLEEGKKEAFNHYSSEIQNALDKLKDMMEQFEHYKSRLLIENEEYFVKLVFQIAKNITQKEIKEDPTMILPVIKKVVEDTHSDDEMLLKVNKEDLEFLKTVTDSSKKPWEAVKKLKVEASESVSRGGCILETNHGVIDAQIEQRVQKAWINIESRIPKVNPS
jgi:flagellar assembly protein FliH